jgi:RNA polymerase sigma factor (sigma-70 family)
MPQAPFGTVLRHIRQLVGPEQAGELSDAQLLERFAARREEAAFAVLLQRHGRLVWSVCWQILHHDHDAEDAFQATFLVLARHAASIRNGQAVSGWLHHVAQRIALKASMDRARRQAHERQAEVMTPSEPGSDFAWRELQGVLDAQLQRLPEKYRAPFVLCCLEGRSKAEAARLLGWKEGTVSGRLAQARRLLQQRLARRGITLSAVLCATTLALEAGPAPAALLHQTLRAAVLYAADPTAVAGVPSARAAALAEGVTKAMFVTKAKLATAFVLAVGLLAAGFSLLTRQALAARQADRASPQPGAAPQAGQPASAVPPGAQPAVDAGKEGKEDGITIQGRVLGPDGMPVAGARVRLVNVEAESDREGTYRVTLPRPAGVKGAFTRSSVYWYVLAATAEGYGVDFRPIGTADRDGNLDLHLVKDLPIEGRILDLEGRPVAGATVRVGRLSAVPDENLDVFLKAWKWGPTEALSGGSYAPVMMSPRGGKVKQVVRPQWRTWWGYWEWNPIKPVTTGKDGTFRLTGVGRERFVELVVSGPAIQQAQVRVVTRKGIDVKDLSKPDPDYLKQGPFIQPVILPFPPLYGSTFEHLVGPTKPVAGVVRDRATGKPLAGVRVLGRASGSDFYNLTEIETVTDAKGQYRLIGFPKTERYFIAATTKERTTHLPEGKELNDTEGLKPLPGDLDLVRGVTVSGKLIDKATGKPASGTVSYSLLPANSRFVDAGPPGSLLGRLVNQRQIVPESGEFQLTVFPGPGVLYAQTDSSRYLPIVVAPEDRKKGVATFPDLTTGGVHVHGHAYRVIDPAEGSEPLKVDLEFLTGRTLTGTVVGPEGKPLAGAVGILARVAQPPFGIRANQGLRIDKDSAQFTLDGIDPRQPPLLIFRHPEKKLALRLEVRGDEKDPLTARLQPGGKLTGRILDAAGQPLADARIDLLLGQKAGPFSQPNTFVSAAKTDKEGRFTLEGIVPETGLMLLIGVTARAGPGRTIHAVNDLTWKAGEAKDLGDVKTQFKPKPPGNE